MKIKLSAMAALTAISFFTTSAAAQQAPSKSPSPEQMKEIMQASLGAMVSVMAPLTDAVIEAQLNAAAKPETATRIASFKKNLYESLLKQGFNGQDAMRIVIATSLPSASPTAK